MTTTTMMTTTTTTTKKIGPFCFVLAFNIYIYKQNSDGLYICEISTEGNNIFYSYYTVSQFIYTHTPGHRFFFWLLIKLLLSPEKNISLCCFVFFLIVKSMNFDRAKWTLSIVDPNNRCC